jgi:hypothetical protein
MRTLIVDSRVFPVFTRKLFFSFLQLSYLACWAATSPPDGSPPAFHGKARGTAAFALLLPSVWAQFHWEWSRLILSLEGVLLAHQESSSFSPSTLLPCRRHGSAPGSSGGTHIPLRSTSLLPR